MAEDLVDGLRTESGDDLLGTAVDRSRLICIETAVPATLSAALAGLANTTGGAILIGARLDDTSICALTGVDAASTTETLAALAGEIDPPLDGLVQARTLRLSSGSSLVAVSVRQSSSPPHLEPRSGRVYVNDAGEIRPIRRRDELDRLIAKGRTADDRAERVIAGTIERLSLAHFGHFGMAVVACLRASTAEPYLWFQEHPDALADVGDPFVAEWNFSADAVRVGSGELELRNEREAAGVLRVGRAGYAVAAEIRRHPPRHVLGTAVDLARRIDLLVASAFRILQHADRTVLLPRLVCDGLKSCRLSLNREGAESEPCSIDSLQIAGEPGDARDPDYQATLSRQFLRGLLPAFGLAGEGDAGA